MNISKGLLHRSRPGAVDGPSSSMGGSVPPAPESPTRHAGARWPTDAKVLVALLLVATVVATIAAAIGARSGDDAAATVRSLREEVASLTAARNEADADVAALDAELVTLRRQLDEVEAANDALDAESADLEAQIAALTEQAAGLEAQIASVAEERDAATAKVEQLDAALVTERQRTTAAVAERDALAALFPMTFDSPFGLDAAVGVYDVSVSRVYCAGLATCATTPALADLTIAKASGDNARFSIPEFASGDMFWADGAYHAVVDSTTVLPGCDGVARTGRVWMTIFPGTIEVERDRVPRAVALQGVISIEAAPVGTCSGVLAFYSTEFSPHA